uniref:Putative secreted protein n=1 Tax=Ixodes ricinus TaxID=34613 RepID=A0A6B0UNV4_IXORI
MSAMTALLRILMLEKFSNMASMARKPQLARKAMTPMATPKLQALESLLYRQRSSSQAPDEMQPNTTMENSQHSMRSVTCGLIKNMIGSNAWPALPAPYAPPFMVTEAPSFLASSATKRVFFRR